MPRWSRSLLNVRLAASGDRAVPLGHGQRQVHLPGRYLLDPGHHAQRLHREHRRDEAQIQPGQPALTDVPLQKPRQVGGGHRALLDHLDEPGSLREGSYNKQLAKAIGQLAGDRLSLQMVRIDDLPLYNQDFDADYPANCKRLKQDIEPVGRDERTGLTLYRFAYKTHPQQHYIGVMADEVEAVAPEAVITMPNGFKAVHYEMLGIKMRKAAAGGTQ